MTSRYRADIDGLRAVAVGAVIAFHAFPAAMPGGFVGVDVFFVISGFLITGLIAARLETRAFSLADFYVRRMRRIFPALAAVLLAAACFGWAFLLPDEWSALGTHLFGGAAFVANLALARQGGYFERSAPQQPLLHLWSLGIEEQFYFVWPLLLLLLWAVRPRLRLALASLLVVASFVLNCWGVERYPTYTFYLPFTRFWELGIGSLLALVRTAPLRGRARAELASWSGLALLIASVAMIRPASFFPGYWALLPTAGTALMILAGPTAWFNRVVLSNRAFTFVGLISYPLYLWHWPILSFARICHPSPLHPATLAALIAFAVACSVATYAFIEIPIRSGSWRPGVLRMICGLLVLLAAIGVSSRTGVLRARLSGPALSAVITASADWTYPFGGNFGKTSGFVASTVPGDRTKGVVLFIGDSHLEQYWARLDALRANGPVPEMRFATNGGCPPIRSFLPVRGEPCRRFVEFALDLARDPEVTTVVLGAHWLAYLTPESAPAALVPLESDIRTLRRLGKRVFVVLASPASAKFNPRFWFSRLDGQVTVESVTLTDLKPGTSEVAAILRRAALTSGAEVIDPLANLCASGACPTVDRGRIVYRDESHLRPFFVREHATFIDPVLRSP